MKYKRASLKPVRPLKHKLHSLGQCLSDVQPIKHILRLLS